MVKPLTVCVDHNKLENSSRDGNTRPPDLPPEKTMQVKKPQLELGMAWQLAPDWERSTSGLPSGPSNQKKCRLRDLQLEVELCWIEDCAALLQLLDIIDGNKTSHVWGKIHQIKTKIMNRTGFFVIAVR